MNVQKNSPDEPKTIGPIMPDNMISGRQDWDSNAALERRALMISSEICRLNGELTWISEHIHPRDNKNRTDQSRSSLVDLEQCDDWNESNDQDDESSLCAWYIISAIVIIAAIVVIIIVVTQCCSI